MARGSDADPARLPQMQPRSRSQASMPTRQQQQLNASLPPRAARQPRGAEVLAPWQQAQAAASFRSQPASWNKSGGAAAPAMALDNPSTEELLRVGPWSVRGAQAASGLVYVNMDTGETTTLPPPEVLADLDLESESTNGQGDRVQQRTGRRRRTDATDQLCSDIGAHVPESPQFRRIILGHSREMPLAMARDILAALREDESLFGEVQRRFSDGPAHETNLEFGGDLPEELESAAAALRAGEFSNVIGTEAGMQILQRVA